MDGCVSGRAYCRSPARRVALIAIVAVAAALLLPMCYFTSGEPRRSALEQAIVLTNKKAAAANLPPFTPPAPSVAAPKGDDDIEALFASAAAVADSDPCKGWGLSDMILCMLKTTPEQRDEQALIDALKALMRQVSDDGEASLSLPSPWLPSAFVCMSLFVTVVGSGLFALMCHWSPAFHARALHAPPASAALDTSAVILVQPPPNRCPLSTRFQLPPSLVLQGQGRPHAPHPLRRQAVHGLPAAALLLRRRRPPLASLCMRRGAHVEFYFELCGCARVEERGGGAPAH